jgi:uncharacterized membrane protein
MPSPLAHPNWHAALVHYPLALLTLGVIIEVLAFFWRRSTVRIAARWMILLGALGLLPSLASGLYAFRDLVWPGGDPQAPWSEVVSQSKWTAQQWGLMRDHILLGACGSAVTVLAALLYLGAADATRNRWRLAFLALVLLGTATIVVSAWHGGESVYRHGTGVAIARPTPDATTEPARRQSLQDFVAPLELHVTLAGLTIAAAVGAFGATLRRFKLWAAASRAEAKVDRDADRMIAAAVGTTVAADDAPAPAMVYPSRLWLLALVFAAATAAAGLWATGDWEFHTARAVFSDPQTRSNLPRLAAHVAFATTILALLLLLFVVTTVLRRWRLITHLLVLLLVLAVACQVWVGILMLYDSNSGPVTGWNASGGANAPASAPSAAP